MDITHLDSPHRDSLPLISLQTSRFRPLETLYRPLPQIFHMLLEYFFPLFPKNNGVVEVFALDIRRVAVAWLVRVWHDKTHDLESFEVLERFAYNDQF